MAGRNNQIHALNQDYRVTFGQERDSQNMKPLSPLSRHFRHQQPESSHQKINNLVHLNDRGKMRLTESVASDEELQINFQRVKNAQNQEILHSEDHSISRQIPLVSVQQKNNNNQSFLKVSSMISKQPSQVQISQIINDLDEPPSQEIGLIDTKNSFQILKNPLILKHSHASSENSLIDQLNSQTSRVSSFRAVNQPPESNIIAHVSNKPMKKRRIKIFDRQYLKNREISARSRSPISKDKLSTTRYTNFNQHHETISLSHINHDIGISDRACSHNQCLLKSLEIIDKLSENKLKLETSQISQSDSRQKRFDVLCGRIYQISLELNNSLTKLQLNDLKEESSRQKMNTIKEQIDDILCNMRQQQYFSHCIQISKQSAMNPLHDLRLLYERVNLLSLISERYKNWHTKLGNLAKDLSDVLSCEHNQRKQKLQLMCSYVRQLREHTVVIGDDDKFSSILKSFNEYLERQAQMLEQTEQWIRDESIRVHHKQKQSKKQL